MNRKTPCFNCQKRCEGCHSSCEDYKAYRSELSEIKEKCREIYTKNDIIRDVEVRHRTRIIKRYGRKK